jgi:hypothetical protein
LLDFFFDPEKQAALSSTTSVNFIGLHGVISPSTLQELKKYVTMEYRPMS